MEFVSTKNNFLFLEGNFLKVPCTKSEIFQSDDLELKEKERLLSFIHSILKLKNNILDVNSTLDYKKDLEVEDKLMNLISSQIKQNGDKFLYENFNTKMATIIKLVLANSNPNTENHSLEKYVDIIYRYLTSLQIYGDSPFLIPIYGSSEFSQSICRTASLFSTIFIVNNHLKINISKLTDNYKIVIEDTGKI